jgi:hypothetical protein
MSFLDRLRIRRGRGGKVASMDREATPEDLDDLRGFARTRVGVELYVEPETMVTDTTAVAVATDGEWIRRRVGSPRVVRRLAHDLRVPVYDVEIVGYPERMRAYNARLKASGGGRVLRDPDSPPVRTSRPPSRTPRPTRSSGGAEGAGPSSGGAESAPPDPRSSGGAASAPPDPRSSGGAASAPPDPPEGAVPPTTEETDR